MSLSQSKTWISNAICCGFFFCVQWFEVRDVRFDIIGGIVDLHCLNFLFMWEMVVHFDDISGIADLHCLNFLFIKKYIRNLTFIILPWNKGQNLSKMAAGPKAAYCPNANSRNINGIPSRNNMRINGNTKAPEIKY